MIALKRGVGGKKWGKKEKSPLAISLIKRKIVYLQAEKKTKLIYKHLIYLSNTCKAKEH